jgi:hypothetical protein
MTFFVLYDVFFLLYGKLTFFCLHYIFPNKFVQISTKFVRFFTFFAQYKVALRRRQRQAGRQAGRQERRRIQIQRANSKPSPKEARPSI